jgi:hypothetical protein
MPRAIVEHLNADEFVRLAPPMRPLSYGPAPALPEPILAGDLEARKIIDGMLDLAARLDRAAPGGFAQAAKSLLAAGAEQDLSRVRKLIGLVLEFKQALDEAAGAQREPDLRRAS